MLAEHGKLKPSPVGDENTTVDSFKGSLKIAATDDVIDALFEVSEQGLRVTSGGEELGMWPLPEVSLTQRPDGVHLSLDGERVVVNVDDSDSFTNALAPPRRRPRGRREKKRSQAKHRKRPVQPEPPAHEPEPLVVDKFDPSPAVAESTSALPKPKRARRSGPGMMERIRNAMERIRSARVLFDKDNWETWLQDRLVRWSIACGGVIILALLVLFAANTLGMILVLVGMVALIIAALAVSDDLSAYRAIPNALNETTMVIAGASAMAIGALLILIG